jgi:ribosomal protein S12 methylthiotransferase accessory factor
METQLLSSSLRAVTPEITLLHAKSMAVGLGISRVTNTTRLDSVGIPVYASVRPTAVHGSLCVNAGKGIRPIDAEVGAYMEAIEFAVAEPDTSHVPIVMATARDVLDGALRPGAILDFCPIVRTRFDPAAPLACVQADEIVGCHPVLVPAELVFLPYVGRPGTGGFGSHSNGLASGNTESEAFLHGLLEVVERDTRAFQRFRPHAKRIHVSTVPAIVQAQLDKIRDAGLEISVHALLNEFGIPCFEAVIFDPDARTPGYLNGGYGCHLHRDIAVLRAITEAAQSRLSWIHGGRDDLERVYSKQRNKSATMIRRETAAQFEAYLGGDGVAYEETPDLSATATSIDEAISTAVTCLLRRGIKSVCSVVLTRSEDPLKVVRVIVPRLEHFSDNSHRMGPRLHAVVRGTDA